MNVKSAVCLPSGFGRSGIVRCLKENSGLENVCKQNSIDTVKAMRGNKQIVMYKLCYHGNREAVRLI